MSKVVYLNEENFKEEVKEGVVLVDFYADWCGPCKMLGPILEELSTETDAKICKVDVEANPNLATEFSIRSIPAIYILKDGQAVENLVGLQPKEQLAKVLAAHK